MKPNSKATGANCGSSNPFDLLTGNQRLSAFDYDEKLTDLQSNLEANLARHKKVIRLFRCFACEKNCTVRKMSNCLVVCRECYRMAQVKGKIARKNFVEKALNNFHKFLRRRIAI
jgi:hypothetical protein